MIRINSIPTKDLYRQYVSSRDMRPSAANPPMGKDGVELTESAKSFSAALRAAKLNASGEAHPVSKTDALRARIENNDYHVPGEAVAAKMLGL